MARFSTAAFATSDKSSATFMTFSPWLTSLLFLSNSMTQSFGRRNPDVLALEVNCEDVVVRRSRVHCDWCCGPHCVAHVHFWFAGSERRSVYCPVYPVVVGQSLVRTKPGPRGVQALYLVGEVRRQPAVFDQEIMPVPPVIVAVSKIGCHPQDFIHIAHRGRDLMDQPLVLEQN